MEILNNIWNALSTENFTVIQIITILTIPIEVFFCFSAFTLILKLPYTSFQKYTYLITVTIFTTINSTITPKPFNVILNYIVLFIIILYLFKLSLLKTILCVVIPLVIFGLCNSLIMNPFLKILNISFEMASNIPLYKILYLSFTYLTIYLVLLLIKSTKSNLVILDVDLDSKTRSTILINLILGILTLFIQATINFYYINNVPIIFTLFNFALLFAYFFFNFYSLIKTTKLDIATRDLENAESYNNSLTVLYDNVKAFKHDFDNMVNIISGYLQVNDITGLKKYFKTFDEDYKNITSVQMLNPNIINNPGIYNLIVSKYKKATDLDVIINFEFFFDFENLKIPIYEFSRILGILLDNAIEAANECEQKQINLLFRESQKQHVQIISIENTYLNKDIDTDKIFDKGFSGKENHTGIGLWEVKKIINRFNNVSLKTSKDDKLFKQELQIYY